MSDKYAENAKRITGFQTILLELHAELGHKIKATGKDKEFYIDMIGAEQAERASKVLDQVAVSMSEVIDELGKLGPQMDDFLKPVKTAIK